MTVLRWLTAGESHGPMLIGILDGMPAGMPLREEDLAPRMRRRQGGHGRGKRMTIEPDRPVILGGTWHGETTGAPIGIAIENRSNRAQRSQVRRTHPRPGHADLAGVLKYGLTDINPVLERASARETAMRTALGAVCCQLLELIGARLTGRVIALGGVEAPALPDGWGPDEIERTRDESAVACCDADVSAAMVARVDEAREQGETLGGRIELRVWNLPPGLGTYAQSDRRLDARLGAALLSIPSVKECELGDALAAGAGPGSAAHDVIVRVGEGLGRASNRAGGLEAGVTNGETLVARITLKPISTLRRPLPTVDLDSGQEVPGRYVRSDVCVVPAATVIAEAVAALVLADAVLEKFGADRFAELRELVGRFRAGLPRWAPEARP